MQEFGKHNDWKRVFWSALAIFIFFVFPISGFFIYVVFQEKDFQFIASLATIVLIAWYVSLRYLHTLYTFPNIQIDSNFLVVNDPLSKRKIYNLNKISNFKYFLNTIYFKHNSWSVFINLNSLTKAEREELCKILKNS